MKCPILPQMRQQRSLGATSPSVRTSGSKKYSCDRQRQVTLMANQNLPAKCRSKLEITDHLGWVLGRKGRQRSAKDRSAVYEGLHDKVGHCHGEKWHIRKKLEDKRRNTNVKKEQPHNLTLPGETSTEIVIEVEGIWDQRGETTAPWNESLSIS